jgi:hypothetical protein
LNQSTIFYGLIENGDAAIAKNYGDLLDRAWFKQEL